MPPGSQPYIYAPPSHSFAGPYNGFDPKAVSRASLMPPAPRYTPKQEGPLLNFNRHPDSYVVGTLPYGQTDAQPMHRATKKAVKITRWVQLALRILGMIGALGMLVCVICIQNTQDTDSYLIRVPAAVDILSTAYAIYHLMRAAKGRTPASSASYHFFAVVIDAGLVPFYVFIAMLARSQSYKSINNVLRWKSFFNAEGTDKILLSTYLDAIVLASFHLVCSCISLFLTIVFRKISNRPPDMNPLEDNLTSRRKSKHKHKNSELSNLSISAPLTDSTVSFSKSGRSSPAKDGVTTEVRPVSFFHTRRDSDYGYSPHNPMTAQFSRSNVSIPKVPSVYSQPRSEQMSQADLTRGNLQTVDADYEKFENENDRTETLKSDKTAMTSSSVYTVGSKEETNARNTPPLPRRSSKRHSFLSDNWFVNRRNGREQDENANPAISEAEEYSALPIEQSNSAYNYGPFKGTNNQPYQLVRQHSDYNDDPRQRPAPPPKDDGFHLAPLGMNPPTPPPGAMRYTPRGTPLRTPERLSKPLGATSGNANAMDSRERNSPSPSPSKSRYYGDLGSAMAGIRNSPGASPKANQQRPKSKYDSGVGGLSTDWRKGGSGDGPYAGIKKQDFAPGVEKRGERVVSTGADITDQRNARFYDYADNDGLSQRQDVRDAGLRGRNVSGKVAEEGRAGRWVPLWR